MPAHLMTGAALLAMAFQVGPPPTTVGLTGATSYESFGAPEPAELWGLNSGAFECKTVILKGTLDLLEKKDARSYYELRERGGRAVIIPVPTLNEEVESLLGRRVEVVGFVKTLHENRNESGREPRRDCDNGAFPTPDLTPDRQGWPRVSITIWSIVDITPFQRRESAASGSLDGPPGARVTLLGQFAGANLGGELPSQAPEPGAWVLKAGEASIWVVGKEPKGKGWSFDPGYRGDVGKWLEVQGRLATCGTQRCVRATRLTLTSRPAGEEP